MAASFPDMLSYPPFLDPSSQFVPEEQWTLVQKDSTGVHAMQLLSSLRALVVDKVEHNPLNRLWLPRLGSSVQLRNLCPQIVLYAVELFLCTVQVAFSSAMALRSTSVGTLLSRTTPLLPTLTMSTAYRLSGFLDHVSPPTWTTVVCTRITVSSTWRVHAGTTPSFELLVPSVWLRYTFRHHLL
ncbi:hypothetical protein C8Q80DRAFT_696760 [Daedaleopsis nitida]|nr:hypothetical protein C8Q80DRAFT_696760 [Daedaleopsis nitida]